MNPIHVLRCPQTLLLLSLLFIPLKMLDAQEPVQLECKELQESSGVAVSNLDPDLIWSHNDSGGKPRLYLFNRRSGKLRGTYELKDVANIDWEDMCSFRVGDQSFLAIADTGDNSSRRKHIEICIIKEPKTPESNSIDPDEVNKIKKVTTLEVHYPNGAADCESIAFDPMHSRFVLLTKEPISCRVFSVPVDAQLFSDFEDKKVKVDAEYLQRFSISLVTGADLCSETRQLVFCTYGMGFLIKPSADKPQLWERNSLIKITLPKRKQGEAIAFVNPEQIITTSEFAPTPLWTTTLPK